MSSAFERLQKLAEEKRLKARSEKPHLEIVPVNTEDKPSAVSAGKSMGAPGAGTPKTSVAPERDFTKVANSIVRQIPNGIFVGKSKQMYDYLYSLTRGAIKPARTIRMSKSSLMRGSGIKSTHTYYNNIRHLVKIGLIAITRIDGEADGNQFEVFLPEELKGSEHLAHLEQLTQLTALTQKLHVAASAGSALTALGSNPMDMGVAEPPKTSLKTKTKNDDDSAHEAFAAFIAKFQAASEELTGRKISQRDGENLEKIADLLILELKIAARRTSGISSVPAFLTEILRRRLRDVPPDAKSSKVKIDTVGKAEAADGYEIKALDAAGREAALEQLAEFADDDLLPDFRKWYTAEDWDWLLEKLKNQE